jgi:hypothetical protein
MLAHMMITRHTGITCHAGSYDDHLRDLAEVSIDDAFALDQEWSLEHLLPQAQLEAQDLQTDMIPG